MPACAFCCREDAVLSGEHVWSEWMGNLFGPPARRRFLLRQYDREGAIRERNRSRIDLRADVICATCNNEWLSDLENNAKPVMMNMILTGAPVSLLPEGIVTVVCWAFKTAVVIDHMTTRRRPFFKPASRQAFMRNLSIPEGVQVWLGEYRGADARRGNLTTHYLRPRTAPRLNGFEFYVLTFVVGKLTFQLLAPRWTRRRRRRQTMPLLRHLPDWDISAVRTWPSDGTPLSWPPPDHLTDRTFDQFCYRWARIPLE